MIHASRIPTILWFVLLAGCTPPDSDQAEDTGNLMREITITGSLTYRERIALPPGSVAQVNLSDISVADAAAPVIAENSIELGDRQVPIPFELTVRGDDLEPGRRYGVRAVIRDPDGRLVWTTDTANPIDAGETQIDLGTLLLVRARSDSGDVAPAMAEKLPGFTARGNEPGWLLTIDGQTMTLNWNYGDNKTVVPRPEPTESTDGISYVSVTEAQELRVDVVDRICRDSMSGMPYPNEVTVTIDGETLQGCGGAPASLLQGGEWVVEDIAGKGIVDDSRATLNFGEDGNLTGHGSCNSYGATWKLSGEGLTVEQGRATLMACSPELDAQEKEFLRLLAAANHFDITDDGALVFQTANGETITARRE